MISISYLEGNQQYREGKISLNDSPNFFKKAIKRIFPEIILNGSNEEILNIIYNQVRCGLFHDGMTRPSITINGEHENSISFSNSNIIINPYKFLDKIIRDFENYISELKNPSNKVLRENFRLRFAETR